MRTTAENYQFIVFKSSLDTYRILNRFTGQFITEDAKNIVLKNAKPIVNLRKYEDAKLNNFDNSGDKKDFFAYLLCESFEIKQEPNVFQRIKNRLYFNPFKSKWFRDKNTNEVFRPYHTFKFVFIEGNELRYL